MTVHYSPKRVFLASLLVAGLSGLTVPAMALDADDFATKLAALSARAATV
jgi:hypothetical protein